MSWLSLVSNPKAVLSMFDREPPLDDVEFVTADFDVQRSFVRLSLSLSVLPERPPKRWQFDKFNSVSIELLLSPVSQFVFRKNGESGRAKVVLSRGDDGLISASVLGKSMQFEGTCEFVQVARLVPIQVDGGTRS